MVISGVGLISPNLESENKRAVEKASSTSKESYYYQDKNPERTRNNDFARALQKAQSDLQKRDYKKRKFKESDDYHELQRMQPKEIPSWVETITHVSEWDTSGYAPRPMDLLTKTGW